MNFKQTTIFIFSFFFGFVVNAQEEEKIPTSFSLEEAKAYAIEHSYQAENAVRDIEKAKMKVKETTAIGLPQIFASGSFQQFIDIPTQVLPDFVSPAVTGVLIENGLLPPSAGGGETSFIEAQFGTEFNVSGGLNLSQLLFSGSYIVALQATKTYLAMVSQVDEVLGKIVAALDRKGIRENTVIVFHSDNGGAVKRKYSSGDGDTQQTVSNNGPFRSGSGSLYEGGIRVPAIISWPEKINHMISTERVHVSDMYTTLLGIAGASLGKNEQIKPLDGIDLLPLLYENELLPKRVLVLNVTEFGGAIMMDDWKLIVISTLPSQMELYDIGNDPSEDTNVLTKHPEIADKLMSALSDAAWEMSPSLYLQDLSKARIHYTPMIWGGNPQRP